MSVISESEAKQVGVRWVTEETRQRDYWTVRELASIERQREIEFLHWQLDQLTMPGWRFMFWLDETNPEAMQECAEMERRHFEKYKDEIEAIRKKIDSLDF